LREWFVGGEIVYVVSESELLQNLQGVDTGTDPIIVVAGRAGAGGEPPLHPVGVRSLAAAGTRLDRPARPLRREQPALALGQARVRQPHEHVAVASAWRAPTSEHQPAELVELRHQGVVFAPGTFPQLTLVERDALAARTVYAHHEPIAPLRGGHPFRVAPYIDVVALALAVQLRLYCIRREAGNAGIAAVIGGSGRWLRASGGHVLFGGCRKNAGRGVDAFREMRQCRV